MVNLADPNTVCFEDPEIWNSVPDGSWTMSLLSLPKMTDESDLSRNMTIEGRGNESGFIGDKTMRTRDKKCSKGYQNKDYVGTRRIGILKRE